MTVFVLYSSNYDTFQIHGVYPTLTDAKAAVPVDIDWDDDGGYEDGGVVVCESLQTEDGRDGWTIETYAIS